MNKKEIKLSDFLKDSEILKCIELREAKLICEQVISPQINRINYDLGQPNDPMYLSYVVQYLLLALKNKGQIK